jgi:outer membrane receptor protein involved in Fe transport
MIKPFFKVLGLLFALFCESVPALEPDEMDLDMVYGDEETVSIATGSRRPLNLAPAVTSVITAAQIEKIGATDIDQVLETVPGLHVSVSATAYNPIYEIRGIHSDTNTQVLLLINGLPLTNVSTGNRGLAWGGMPIKNIARIEVIRGPGSAIFGADAFAGVINIITKTAEDIDGLEIGGRGGNFDRGDGWLLYGGNLGELDIAFSLQGGTTSGQKRIIDADAQTFFDRQFGTSASLAPGPVNLDRTYIDTSLDLSLDEWRLRLWYQRRNIGTGAGAAQALDPIGVGTASRFNADLTYHNTESFDNWDLTAQLSFFDVANETDLVLFPPGAAFPGSDGQLNSFPRGVIGNPDVFERHYRTDLWAFYTGFNKHTLRFGTGFRLEDMYKIREEKNFFQPGPFPEPLPGGRVVDVTSIAAFNTPHSRNIVYLFGQDEWNFARDWTLTAGLRYDYYSDFGNTFNPRLALVWQTAYNLTSKLLYGRAFRAPSFTEQFNINNPVSLGSSNLDPETIDSVELAFDYQPWRTFRTKLNLYWYLYQDIIRFVPDPSGARTARNSGDQTGYGLEFESTWDITDTLRLYANYAFQKSIDDSVDADVGFAPTHQVYARADWRFLPKWNLDTQFNWVGDRKRSFGDLRPPVNDYTTLDLTLRGSDLFHGLGVSLAVKNLFDTNTREPSLPPGLIPNDLPLSGRNYYFELRYELH